MMGAVEEHNRRVLSRRMAVVISTLLVAWGLVLWPVLASAQGDSRVAINRDLTIEKGETVDGDVSVTNGNLTILGNVDGEVAVTNGNADIEGEVSGDVTVLFNGSITLGPSAQVGGNLLANGDI